jgi:hypothetical protein
MQSLTESTLLPDLPELRRLHYLVERNGWHDDDVRQQSLRLFRWVKRLPASLFETISAPETTLRALLTSIVDPANGHYTTQELLAFTALIHDVGKAETFQRLADGTTRCPGHEAVSARLAPAICARFGFTPVETRFITTLVGAHGGPYALFKEIASMSAPQQQEQIRRFQADHADRLLPLLLLACGDLMTSHLQAKQPEKYAALLEFYWHWIQSVLSKESKGARESRGRDEIDPR